MKECDKRNSHISSKLHVISVSSNNVRYPVTKTFTTLHCTCRHFISSHLNFTQLHFTALSFGLTPYKFPTAPLHLKSLYFTPIHFTEILDDFCHTSVTFVSHRLQLLPNSVSTSCRFISIGIIKKIAPRSGFCL